MGWVAERVDVRAVVMFGAVKVCAGLALSSRGEAWQLYVGHGLLIGLIGNGTINAPLYVARWFERRRGTALAPDHGRFRVRGGGRGRAAGRAVPAIASRGA